MHSVLRCSLQVWRRSLLKKETLMTYFGSPWIHPLIWRKHNNTCKGPWVLHPYQISSKSIQQFWRRSRKCEKFTDDGRTDGRCAMTIPHSSLRLRWAKIIKSSNLSSFILCTMYLFYSINMISHKILIIKAIKMSLLCHSVCSSYI